MSTELFLALVAFALVTSITPGPNNLMLLASGANFGFRRTIPHMFGIALGMATLIFSAGAGLAQLLWIYPGADTALRAAGMAYMLWLAWRLWSLAPRTGIEHDGTARPMSLLQAAAFQWVNPKAWSMAVAAVSAYAPDRSFATVGLIAGAFALVNLPSVSVWAWSGQHMSGLLGEGRRQRLFNRLMAVLLVVTLYPVFLA